MGICSYFITGCRISSSKSWKSILGLQLLWAGLAWWVDMKNNGVLSEKIANVLPLGGNTIYLIMATGFVGGLVAGLAAMSGSFLRSAKSIR